MVRMRPCADGAQAPHWLPLCSCYCCHCSCAVSGQFHNASPFFFVNVFMSCLTPTFPWCFSSLCFFVTCFPLPCSTTSCVFPLFSCPYLSHLSLFLMACQHLASPPPSHPNTYLRRLTNIYPISPDFEPQAMLFVSLPIIIGLRQNDLSVYHSCHLTSDVTRCSVKHTTHFSFVSLHVFISTFFPLRKQIKSQASPALLPLQMLSIQSVGVLSFPAFKKKKDILKLLYFPASHLNFL